jgi:hypothetical protein
MAFARERHRRTLCAARVTKAWKLNRPFRFHGVYREFSNLATDRVFVSLSGLDQINVELPANLKRRRYRGCAQWTDKRPMS